MSTQFGFTCYQLTDKFALSQMYDAGGEHTAYLNQIILFLCVQVPARYCSTLRLL